MSEEEFWNCTHKKLLGLIKVKREEDSKKFGQSNDNNVEEEYIDNIIL